MCVCVYGGGGGGSAGKKSRIAEPYIEHRIPRSTNTICMCRRDGLYELVLRQVGILKIGRVAV